MNKAKCEEIIKRWEDNLSRSEIVDIRYEGGTELKIINKRKVRAIFNGKNRLSECASFLELSGKTGANSQDKVINNLIKYLNYIGIDIQKEKILSYVGNSKGLLYDLIDSAFYLYKYFAYVRKVYEVNPFEGCKEEIKLLAGIECSEAKSKVSDPLGKSQLIHTGHSNYLLPKDVILNKDWGNLFNSIEYTNTNHLLNGIPGTGKTTFIKYFLNNTEKKCLVLGTTGIAAQQIGGRTLHYFFEFEPRIYRYKDSRIKIFHKGSIKLDELRNANTIIIDEISMLRADMLYALDYSLQQNCQNEYLFGGKQMIFTGDLLQLGPVLGNDESSKKLFDYLFPNKHIYDTVYLSSGEYFKYFEFNKPFRQKDKGLVEMLLKIRNQNVDEDILQTLNEKLINELPERIEPEEVILTTTRKDANWLNLEQLNKIESKEYIYEAEIVGKHNHTKRYSFMKSFQLKEGVPVIFTKNDKEKRWLNGNRGIIDSLGEEFIKVRLQDGSIYEIEKVNLIEGKEFDDPENDTIRIEPTVRVYQYPIELAFAMTIHKSQGQTLNKVIIYKGDSFFTPGLLYTALGRVRSLDDIKIYLHELTSTDFAVDSKAIGFLNKYETKALVY